MRNKHFLSIDIQPECIRLGHFLCKGGILHVIALETFPSKEALREYLISNRLKYLEALGSLGGVHLIARSISLSSVGSIDFEKAILKSIRSQIPTSADAENVTIKYQILSTKYEKVKETIDVLVAVAKKHALIDFLEILKDVQLVPSLVSPGHASLFLPFVSQIEENEITAVLNIRRYSTDVVIVENGLPYFVSKLDIGESEFLKSNVSLQRSLSSVLDFYIAGNGGKRKIQKVIVTGKAQERACDYLAKRTEYAVQQGVLRENSFIEFAKECKNIEDYVHVIALAFRRIFPAILNIDLLPDDAIEQLSLIALKRKLKDVSLLLALCIGGIAIFLAAANCFYIFRGNSLARKMTGISAKLETVYELKHRNKALREKLAAIEPIIGNEIAWDKVLFEISKLSPSEMLLTSIRSDRILKKGVNDTASSEYGLYIAGETISQSKIDRFVSLLEDSPLFQSVEIEGIEKKSNIAFELKLILR